MRNGNMIEIIPYLSHMFLKRIVTLFITFLILFADSGQMIYAHTCLKSNHTSFSLYAPGNCCAKKESTKSCCAKKIIEEEKKCTLGKMSCCSVSSKYVKQSFPNNEVKLQPTEITREPATEITLFSVYIISSVQNVLANSPPPLLRCKDDIRFTQVFRI